MMTSTVRKFGVGVASLALVASAAAPAFAKEEPVPLNGGWDRIASDRVNNDRIDTAIAVAKVAYPKPSDAKAVYIAGSTAMIDAASAGQLTDGPILLVDPNSRTLDVVKAEVERYTSATTVYAIGGTGVVSDAALKAVAGDKKAARLGGEDRYATAMAVAKRIIEINPEKSKHLLVARADNPIDALAAGPLDFGPLVYVQPNGELSEDVKAWVKDKHVSSVIGLGGKAAVPDKALSDAVESVVKVNPGKVDEEAIKARQAFVEARALYLGVNKYDGDFTPSKKYGIATSRDPKLTILARTDADNRFEGYKALAEEVQERLDVADSAVRTLKMEVSNAIKDAKSAGKDGWTAFAADAANGMAANGRVSKALLALYGTQVVGANAGDVKDKQYFILDSDDKVTGVNYGAIERLDKFTKQVKSDTARIKAYFEKHTSNLLDDGTVDGADMNGVQSMNLFVNKTTSQPNTVLSLADTATNTGSNPVILLQKDSALFMRTAQNNSDAAKLAMDQAWAKMQSAQGYTRLGGADRYATSAMISRYMRTKQNVDFGRVYLANGETMVDALVAGVFSQGPILLVNSAGNITDVVKDELGYIGRYKLVNGDEVTYRKAGQFPTVFAIGGKKAVADATASTAAGYIKAGNDTVPKTDTALVITKQTHIKSIDSGNKVTNTKPAVLEAKFQGDSSFTTAPTVEWQVWDTDKWIEAKDANNKPSANTTYVATTSDVQDGIYTSTLKISTTDTSGAVATKYRMLVTYYEDTAKTVVAKQVASDALTVTVDNA